MSYARTSDSKHYHFKQPLINVKMKPRQYNLQSKNDIKSKLKIIYLIVTEKINYNCVKTFHFVLKNIKYL
jgi:hypothetical protein